MYPTINSQSLHESDDLGWTDFMEKKGREKERWRKKGVEKEVINGGGGREREGREKERWRKGEERQVEEGEREGREKERWRKEGSREEKEVINGGGGRERREREGGEKQGGKRENERGRIKRQQNHQ